MSFRKIFFLSTLTLIASACTGQRFVAQPAPELPSTITERGELIYRGHVYPLEGEPITSTYVYERRVDDEADRVVSTHVTRDGSGVIQLAESADHTPDYSLTSYTLHANQLGQTGDIQVKGDTVTFRVREGDEERTASEHFDAPVVVGPTLVGYIAEHLDDLARGETLKVRMAVLDRLETIGFDLEAVAAAQGQTRIEMSPSSFLIGLAVEPIHFTYDSKTRNLLELTGRVPPKVRDGDRWADFDARVEYEMLAAHYR